MPKKLFHFSIFLALLFVNCTQQLPKPDTAPTPPMGWNSYDCYDWRVNEQEVKNNADYMAEHLLDYGWEYVVVDFLWHLHDPEGDKLYTDRKKQVSRMVRYSPDGVLLSTFAMDEYGRVTPDTLRFPSAKGGLGFKQLADYCHSRGLKFGIHIMRGIPREAVRLKLPIKGTSYNAAEIAEPADTCTWERSMYGIDHQQPGAQEYYNSLFDLYAAWGVDFVKADDTMYPVFHKEEIRLISNAMKQCGRPMVLSLSLGEIPHVHESFLSESAHMWRISDDFWDNWASIERIFDLADAWSGMIGPHSWPDADMLPIGHLCLMDQPKGKERVSQLTQAEHYTLLTLWSIARSPLMIGSDLPTLPESTLEFLTNPEVLAVNRHSCNNHLVCKDWYGNVAWMADTPGSDEKYLALFNISDKEREVPFIFDLEYLRGQYLIRDLWKHRDLGIFSEKFISVLPAHGAGLYKLTPIIQK